MILDALRSKTLFYHWYLQNKHKITETYIYEKYQFVRQAQVCEMKAVLSNKHKFADTNMYEKHLQTSISFQNKRICEKDIMRYDRLMSIYNFDSLQAVCELLAGSRWYRDTSRYIGILG